MSNEPVLVVLRATARTPLAPRPQRLMRQLKFYCFGVG